MIEKKEEANFPNWDLLEFRFELRIVSPLLVQDEEEAIFR